MHELFSIKGSLRETIGHHWSNPFLSCEMVSSAMSCDKFEGIKSKLKYSKTKD